MNIQTRTALSIFAVAMLVASSAQAKTKIETTCFYESGQSGGHAVSDFEIWNTAAFPIPKGTVISFTSSGAPGKTFTATAPSNVAPKDSFSSGGTIPAGQCHASWMK